MGLKQCIACSEMVDEAKAYCPGCGNAFVEEKKREEASEYEQADSTIQFGKTMFGEMLSDMGLNLAKPPGQADKRIEVLAPAAAPATPPQNPAAKAVRSSNAKWFILGGVILILGFLIVLVAAGVLIWWTGWWTRFR